MEVSVRAAVLTGHGGPDRIVVRDDVPDPVPDVGQVRVQVSASSVNNTDIWTREGAYGAADDPNAVAGWRGTPLRFPRIQGADAVGVVDAVGPSVARDLEGRRVLVDPAIYDDDRPDATPIGLLGSERDGAFAQYLVADAERVHDVSASPLHDRELAALPTPTAPRWGCSRAPEWAPGTGSWSPAHPGAWALQLCNSHDVSTRPWSR